MKNLVIYQAKNGVIELKADSNVETIWASQKQIARVFDVTPQNITIHLKQIFTNGELEERLCWCHDMFYNFSYHILIFFAFFI
jgi:hypothetical protein